MYRLFDQIEKGKGYEINFLNLREIFLTSYDDFIDVFFKSGNGGNSLKTGTKRQYSLFGLFKLDAFTEKMLTKRQEDPFSGYETRISAPGQEGYPADCHHR